MESITYEQWNLAISEKVFKPENSSRPVYLQVDNQLLSEIGSTFGISDSKSRLSFVSAVRERAKLDSMPLHRFFQDQITWRIQLKKEVATPPPFIGFLGFCVLAAYDMASEQGTSSANYYKRLDDLLGSQHPTRFNEVYQLWERLNQWLDHDLQGNLGRSTARYVNHRHVGYPISQALLRRADRHKLPLLFERCGLEPYETDVTAKFFREELQQWCRLSTFPFNQRFQRIFELEDSDTVKEVTKMVLAEYEVWDGRTEEEIQDGVISAEITLQLDPDFDACNLTLFPPASNLNGTLFPKARYQGNTASHYLTFDPFLDHWFEPLPDSFLQHLLCGNNIELIHRQFKLRFRARSIYLFQQDEGELGCWIHTNSRPELKNSYQLLCHPAQIGLLRSHLARSAIVAREIPLSNGWIWLRSVIFQRIVPSHDDALQVVIPKPPKVRMKFINGLKLGRDRFLQGGEPNVVVTNLSEPMTLFIDDVPCGAIDQTINTVTLKPYDLGTGTHQLRVGKDSTTRHIHIVPSGHQLTNHVPLGRTLVQENNAVGAHQFALATLPTMMKPDEIFISGARIMGGEQVSLDITHPVWVACGYYTRCAIIGNSPNQIVEYRLPRTTEKLDIPFPVLFKPAWIVYAIGKKFRVSSLGKPTKPIRPQAFHQNHQRWAKWVRNAKLPKKNRSLWQAYRNLAKAVG